MAGLDDAHRVRPARVEADLERRLAGRDAVHADAGARGVAREGEHGRGRGQDRSGLRDGGREGHEGHVDALQDAAAENLHPRAVLLVAGGPHAQLALPRLRLEGGERRRAPDGPVDRDLGAGHSTGVDGEAAGEQHEGQPHDLARLPRHTDARLEPAVALLLRDERVLAGQREESVAQPQDGPSPPQRDRVRSRLDDHGDGGEAREEHRPRGGRDEQRREGQPAERNRPAGPRRDTRGPRRVADRGDRQTRIGLGRQPLAARRRHEDDGRLGGIRVRERLDDEPQGVARRADLHPGRAETQRVPVAQPVRRLEPRPVALDRAARSGLHEDLAVGEAEPGEGSRARGDGDDGAGPAERDRELARGELADAPALLDAQDDQMASSHRTLTTGAGWPGSTVNCRRTSR